MNRLSRESKKKPSPILARFSLWAVVFASIAGVALGVFWIRKPSQPLETTPKYQTKNEPAALAYSPESEMPISVRPALVGPQACANCHREKFEGFSQTKHPRTCREVVASEMPPGFKSGEKPFQSVYQNVSFEMSRNGEQFLQTAIRAGLQGESRTSSRIDLILGAGGVADDVFLTWHDDGFLWELPMAWLYPTKEWAASHFDPNGGNGFARMMTVRCVECHNTWVQHVIGTPNQYRREGRLLGVTCEACHGPGGEHVDYHQKNPGVKVAERIVNPARLDRERRIEVCTQCHSNAMRPRGPAFNYRPGQPLVEHFKTLQTNATEDDHVANQITYLRQSKCFQNDQQMTCATCHNPHLANNASNSGAASCAKCHQPEACLDAKNLPTEIRGDCISCHMPSYLKINVNFQTQNDNYVPPIRRFEHRIAVHSHARDETLLKFHRSQQDDASRSEVRRLTRSLVDYYTGVASQCRKEYRLLGAIAALRELVRIEDAPHAREELRAAVQLQTNVDLQYTTGLTYLSENNSQAAIATFESILAIKPNDAKVHGRLGMEYARQGDRARATQHFETVTKCDPNDVYGVAMLAWLAFLDGRHEEALRLYAQAEELEPREAKMKYQIGLVQLKLGKTSDAMRSFRAALEIEPLHADALQALVLALLERKQAKEAIPLIERAARATDARNAHVMAMLGEAYQAAGQPAQANTAYHIAMRLAASQDPSIIPRIQQALNALEASRGTIAAPAH